MTDRRDQDALLRTGLCLFARQGYHATSLNQIAVAADVAPEALNRHYATTEAVVMSGIDALLTEIVRALVELDRQISPADAVLVGTIKALTDIGDSDGVMSADQLQGIARSLSESKDLRRTSTARAKEVFGAALAERLRAGPQDRRVARALTTFEAILAAAYSVRRDVRSSEEIVDRLNEVFQRVTGRPPQRLTTRQSDASTD